jgi:hypothetical protein
MAGIKKNPLMSSPLLAQIPLSQDILTDHFTKDRPPGPSLRPRTDKRKTSAASSGSSPRPA